MTKASASPAERCPRYHHAVEIIGARWSGAILQVMLGGGPVRFGELEAAIPEMSSRMLSQRLRQLEDEGILERTVTPAKPVRIAYKLTSKGRALAPVVQALSAWAGRWVDPR
jgi:DNA-binding HxlR family transcriptional regulator